MKECTNYQPWWPVYYWPIKRHPHSQKPSPYVRNFKWNANGPGKHFPAFFVEYPPPAPREDTSTAEKPNKDGSGAKSVE